MSAQPLKVNASLKDQVGQFLDSRHRDGMRLKGSLMMRNLKALETMAGEISAECAKFGFNDLGQVAKQIEDAAKAGNIAACMALVGQYESQAAQLQVEYV